MRVFGAIIQFFYCYCNVFIDKRGSSKRFFQLIIRGFLFTQMTLIGKIRKEGDIDVHLYEKEKKPFCYQVSFKIFVVLYESKHFDGLHSTQNRICSFNVFRDKNTRKIS